MRFVATAAPYPKTNTALKREIRSLSYNDAAAAVEWLNATQRTPAYRRVLMVRRELEEMGAMLKSLRQLEQEREQWIRQNPPEKTLKHIRKNLLSAADEAAAREAIEAKEKLRAQFRARHNVFNRKIARYAYVPVLDYSPDYGIWRFNAVPKRSRGPKIRIGDGNFNLRVDESTVIAALCRLAANRELFKVRLCAQCTKQWRVSERKIDRFCSQKCRENYYSKSPEFHERKAANQRNYRQRMKAIEQAPRVRSPHRTRG